MVEGVFWEEPCLDPAEPPREGIPFGKIGDARDGQPPLARPAPPSQRQAKMDRMRQQYAAKRNATMGLLVHASESPKRPTLMDSDDSDEEKPAEESAPIAAALPGADDEPAEHVQPVVMEVGRVVYGATRGAAPESPAGPAGGEASPPGAAGRARSQTEDGLGDMVSPAGESSSGAAAAAAAAAGRGARARRGRDGASGSAGAGAGAGEDGDDGLTEAERQLRNRGLAASYDPTAETSGRPSQPAQPPFVLDLTDKRSFLMKPAPKGGTIQCKIVRDRSGMEKLYPRYIMSLEKQDVFFLAARKRKKSKTSNYLLSLDMDDMARDSGNYLGKLRSNVMGTEFVIYDKGESPEKTRLGAASPVGIRQELGVVKYETNVFGLKGPRKMVVLLPKVNEDGNRVQWKPTSDRNSMTATYGRKEMDNMMVLGNKAPTWSDETSSYVLNFKGRVSVASVKNFQLVDPTNPASPVYMQFGRVGADEFTCDFQHPMSALQAFAIALSSFDGKLACE